MPTARKFEYALPEGIPGVLNVGIITRFMPADEFLKIWEQYEGSKHRLWRTIDFSTPDIDMLFQVLKGTKTIEDAMQHFNRSKTTIAQYLARIMPQLLEKIRQEYIKTA